jgi:hypothetical protein
MTSSSVSSGVVLAGAQIAALQTDPAPLSTTAKLNAARSSPTLLHGNINSATIGKSGTANTMIASFVTAGVSPGADGDFSTAADNNVNTTLTGGVSKIATIKATVDAASRILANASGNGVTTVKYTLDSNAATSITASNPVPSTAPTAVATPGHDATVPGPGGSSITVKVTGPADATVNLYDNATTTNVLDTMVISSTTSTPLTVTVTTSTPGTFDLGRVLTTDGTQVGTFTFNGDILGDASGGPALWIDSDMTKFSVRNLPNNPAWSGVIGGNVSNLTVNQLGPGSLRIGGKVTTLNVTTSVGNPLIKQLGLLTPPQAITQMAYNNGTAGVYASDGTNLLNVNVNTGAVNSTVPFSSALSSSNTVSGLTYLNSSTANVLYGVATLNSQLPTHLDGSITTTGDSLRGLAVNSLGEVYAIDTRLDATTNTTIDELVKLDAATGAETIVGRLRNPQGYNSTNNVLALAFDANDNLLAILADGDGNGANLTPASGVALAQIDYTNPSNAGDVLIHGLAGTGMMPTIIKSANTPVVGNFTGFAVDPNGNLFAVQRVGATDVLDSITTAGVLSTIGTIKVDLGATDTKLVGIGFDEANPSNLVGLESNGSASDLVIINKTTPATSIRETAANLLSQGLQGFTLGKTGNVFTAYGFTTDAVNGGKLYSSTGVGPTLGIIDPTTGFFTELLPLQQDAAGTALAGNVLGMAIDANGNAFAVTDQGVLAEYDSKGNLLNVIGPVLDVSNGAKLDITRLGFDGAGELIGLNAHENRLVKISTITGTVRGISGALAAGLTEFGSADATDLTSLAFSPVDGKFLSYSNALGSFVEILGTTPGAIGGVVANAFGTINIPQAFSGRILATGMATGTTLGGIDNIKLTGTGAYTGNISSEGSIGTVASSSKDPAAIFDGSFVSHGDMNSVTVAGGTAIDGAIFAALGTFKSATVTAANFGGLILAGQAGTFTVSAPTAATSQILVGGSTTSLTIKGDAGGVIDLAGATTTLSITGQLVPTGSVELHGDAGAVTLGNGTSTGSKFLAFQNINSLTIGGSLNGVVSTQRSVATVKLNALNNGVLEIGGDISTLTVTGNSTNSVIASGVWAGADGLYNTADDRIFGGGIKTATISGVFQDSVISAGVLPSLSNTPGVNNIPVDTANSPTAIYTLAWTGNPAAPDIAQIDSAEAGGIMRSIVQKLTFSKPVVSSSISQGIFSAVVAADGIGTITPGPNISNLVQKVLSDPVGAPQIVTQGTTTDPLTLQPTNILAKFISPSEIDIVFSEPLNTATLNSANINGLAVETVTTGGGPGTVTGTTTLAAADITFGYTTQRAPDGSIQGVLRIMSASDFNNASTNANANTTFIVTMNINGNGILDRSGSRSALGNFQQPGSSTLNLTNDPYGTVLSGGAQTVNAYLSA